MPDTRLLLIDDHAMFRAGLAVLLRAGLAGLQVQEAATLDEALCQQDMGTPDVVLLDIVLRGLNGLDGLGLLRQRWPKVGKFSAPGLFPQQTLFNPPIWDEP